MRADKCAKLSNVVRRKEFREEKLNAKIDRREKEGKTNEDAMTKNFIGCDENGCRKWSF